MRQFRYDIEDVHSALAGVLSSLQLIHEGFSRERVYTEQSIEKSGDRKDAAIFLTRAELYDDAIGEIWSALDNISDKMADSIKEAYKSCKG